MTLRQLAFLTPISSNLIQSQPISSKLIQSHSISSKTHPISSNLICQYLSISAIICQYLPISANICQYLPISQTRNETHTWTHKATYWYHFAAQKMICHGCYSVEIIQSWDIVLLLQIIFFPFKTSWLVPLLYANYVELRTNIGKLCSSWQFKLNWD